MSEKPTTVRAMERQTKDTHFQLRLARDLLALVVIEVAKDHTDPSTKPSVSKWIRDLIAAELRRRGVLR